MIPLSQVHGIVATPLAYEAQILDLASGRAELRGTRCLPIRSPAEWAPAGGLCEPNPRDLAGVRGALTKASRGRYQRALAAGQRAWSGADLAGVAKSYSGRYATSRENLLVRASRIYGRQIRTGIRYVDGANRRVLLAPEIRCSTH